MTTFRSFLCILISAICVSPVFAEHVSPAQALARVSGSDTPRAAAALRSARTLRHTSTVGDLYIFNSADGFMILPDDDRAPAVLAFSDGDTFSLVGNPALASWLDFYNRQLAYLQSLPPATAKATPRNLSNRPRRAARAEIEPLIKTEWNQEAPYNELCPKVNGHDVVTGCVATAMAQFMKYYNYPARGHGRHSYYWEVGGDTLSLDYDTIPFQWDEMTYTYSDTSSTASKKAVAELMLACGISVDMHYDIGDSGAATTHMGVQLINTFGYSPSLWMAHREYYGYDEWEGMIYDELAASRPVLYSGQGTAGGHQFICDGFKADGYFHFNWGWGGLSNGYFLLTALNPDDLGVGGGAGGFNTDQIATLSAQPAQTGDEPTYIMYNSGGFTSTADSVKAGDDFRADGIYFNFSMSALPDGAVLGMKFTNAQTKAAEYVRGPDVAGIHLDEGRYYDIVKFPALADGTYYVTPALRAGDKWSEVRMPLGLPDRITAVVRDSVATLTSETDATVAIRDVVVPDTIYAAHDFPLKFTAFNSDELEYYANVTPYMLDSSGTAVASSAYRPMDVLPDASEAVTDYVANFAAISGQTFDAGKYSLVFRNSSGQNLSTPVEVYVDTTSVAAEVKVSDFHLITEDPVTDPTKVQFGFTLSCDAGVYYSCPRVLIFPGDGGYDEASAGGSNQYLTAGQSADVTVTGDLDKLKDGRYMAAAYSDGKEASDFIRFEIKRPVSSVPDPTLSESRSEVEVYRLDGVRAVWPLSPGFYVIGDKVVLVR